MQNAELGDGGYGNMFFVCVILAQVAKAGA